jgi:hypothetical protein
MAESMLVTTPLPIEARAYASVLKNVETLYNLAYFATFAPERPARFKKLRLSSRRLPEKDRLLISYVAPGSLKTQLKGLPDAISKLGGMIRDVFELGKRVALYKEHGQKVLSEADKNRAEATKLRAEAKKIAAETLATFVRTLKDAGYTKNQIGRMVSQSDRAFSGIFEAAEHGEITAIESDRQSPKRGPLRRISKREMQ